MDFLDAYNSIHRARRFSDLSKRQKQVGIVLLCGAFVFLVYKDSSNLEKIKFGG